MESEIFKPQLVPLTRWQDGSVRVGQSRVLLDLVIHAFNSGRTPEEIVLNYPTLKLAEVYGTITYYLEHQSEIDDYISTREVEADALWAKIESDPHQKRIRQTLLSRRQETK